MICINPNSIEFKQILAEVGDPLYAEVEYAKRYGADEASKIAEIEKEIKTLPIEIFNSVEVVANVSDDILGNEDISFAMKDVLNENGITDPLLINWAGINKDYFGHPKNIRSTEQLENLIKTLYNKKQKEDKYIEFKTNPLALKSFKEWKEALKEYPLAFQDAMLNHAIKHITNPQRKSKYVLQLSKVALTKAYGIVMNKPHELNRIGKLYDQEVLASVSDAVDHEPSASGNGYWVHVPRTEDVRSKKSYYASNYKTYKEFLEKTKEDIEKLKPLIKELEQIKLKKPVFTTQESNLSREDANKYGFQDYSFIRAESTYSRWNKNVTPNLSQRNQPHIEELGEDYEGYYIHGYNTELGKPEKKILPITKEQAEELWQAEIDRYPDNPEVGYSTKDRQEVYRLNDYKRQLKNLEEAIEKVKPEEWDIKEDDNFKVNVDLLRKLSPSTWCTASSMTEHYVANYDNYLLIVNGVTVAGIEAFPSKTTRTVARFERAEDGSTYEKSFENDEELFEYAKDTGEQYTILQRVSNKTQVKEVTSRANNGVAPIDHLDDIIAFFEKHNLDLDNPSVKRAIKAKAEGKTDKDFFDITDEPEGPYNPHGEGYDMDGYPIEPDWEDYYQNQVDYYEEAEMAREAREAEREFVSNITTEEEAKAHLNLVTLHYESLNPTLRADKEIATLAVEKDPYNIVYVDPTLPFYDELAILAVDKRPYSFTYLSEAGKEIPGLKEKYDAYEKEIDELPFSKTNANLIQGYYDAKNDKVVVVAANTPVNEGAKVAIHEVAHRGMLRMAKELGGVQELAKALFAAEDQLMKKLPELLKRTGHKSLQSLMLDYGFTTESKEGKIKLLMELAARWAETLTDKPKPSWWKQFIESISKWITKFTGKILNENEVNELVGGFVKYGVKTNQRFAEQAPIKPGVSELFESNPELANTVYEALGIYNVWHASDKKIDKFISENVEGYFAKVKKGSPKAVFFTADKAPQESFLSKREYQEQFAVKMNNPLVVDTKTGYSRDNESFKELVDRALAGNHDGVIVKNVDDNGFVGDVYISLNANQISKITPQQKQQALQLYSQYLDTIFPDSKVKDIVYHRTNSDWFKRELFSKKIKPQTGIGEDNKIPEFQDAIYFYYKDKEGHSNVKGKYTFPVILNIKLLGEYTGKGRIFNIASDKKTLDDLENEISRLEKLIARSQDPSFIKEKREEEDKLLKIYNELYDNSKIKQIAQLEEGQGLTYIKKWDFSNIDGITDYRWVLVPSPEQIHILGSKQDIQEFKEFVDKSTFKQLELDPEMSNYIADQISKAFNVPIPGMEKDTLITAEEIENFNRDVENRDGRLPSEYFTGIDDVNKWVLNKSELYDLVDKDTGEIYLKDVNLSTGQVEKQDKPSQPVPDKERQEAIDYLNNAVKDFRIDEILAERGYDVNDIISNLASAENKEEFDKIINKLLRLLC